MKALQVLMDDAMVVEKGIDNLRLVLHNVEICEDRSPINSIAFWCFDTIHTETISNTIEHKPKIFSHVVKM